MFDIAWWVYHVIFTFDLFDFMDRELLSAGQRVTAGI